MTNPRAGRGHGLRIAAVALRRLREAGLAVRSLVGGDAGEARDLVRAAVADGVDSVVVVGGDGLVHQAVQVLAGSGTRLGVVCAGTGNDAARSLGLPTDPVLATDVVVHGRTRRVDLGRCGATRFVTVLAAGFDARVNQRAEAMTRPHGQARYAVATLRELRTLAPVDYTLDLDGRVERLRATLVAVGNGPSYGGGLRIAHGAELDDGLLDVVVVHPLSRRDLARTYPALRTGAHVRHPRYEHHRVRSVSVAAAGVNAYADGERVGPLPLTVEVDRQALEVLVP